jgi:predicted HicB family RNase H-like nuclease
MREKDQWVQVRVTPAFKAMLTAQAQSKGLSVAGYIHLVIHEIQETKDKQTIPH